MTSVDAGMDRETVDLLTGSLRELFAANNTASEVSAALSELGWEEVRQSDPAAATKLLFAEQGRALASSRILDGVVLGELTDVLADHDAVYAVLYPFTDPRDPAVAGVLLGSLDGVDSVVMPSAGGTEVVVFPAAALAGATRVADGFDRGSGWLVVSELPDNGAGEVIAAGTSWHRAQAAAHRALASEIAGLCEAALEKAVDHAGSREQFGRRIATFQAIRHRLSEGYVETAAIRAAVDAAWAAWGSAADGVAARTAKLRAGRAQIAVFRQVIQAYGALALTEEGPVHGYITRAAALDLLLGDHAVQAEWLGGSFLAGSTAHPVVQV